MIVFIGLGNVEDHYADTKHNFGIWVVDEHVRRRNLAFRPGQGDYVYARSNDVVLVKPASGMNRSGTTVKEVQAHWQNDLTDLRTRVGIHELMPGVTGWAQVNGRDELSISLKVQFDEYYLKNRSWFLDLKIIFLTLFKVLGMKGVLH